MCLTIAVSILFMTLSLASNVYFVCIAKHCVTACDCQCTGIAQLLTLTSGRLSNIHVPSFSGTLVSDETEYERSPTGMDGHRRDREAPWINNYDTQKLFSYPCILTILHFLCLLVIG